MGGIAAHVHKVESHAGPVPAEVIVLRINIVYTSKYSEPNFIYDSIGILATLRKNDEGLLYDKAGR